MTMRQIGGGHKKKYRAIDFKREKDNIPAKVKSIEYDPNRTAYIALLWYADGEKRYIVAPDKLAVGSEVMSGEKALPDVGNAMFLKDIPLGSAIHAIEMTPGKGAALARSAGTYGTLVSKEDRYVIVKLPSGEVRRVLATCKATIGMNPIDHPMGGGEGRSSGGHPRSRTGVMAKGQKTRNTKKASNKLIVTRRKKK